MGFGGAKVSTTLLFVVLARLLTPQDFGVVAIAIVFVALLQLLVEGGFRDALIQRAELERGHVDTVFWTSVSTGVLLAGCLVLAAGPLSVLYREPLLAQILPVLTVGLLASALGATQVAQLRRALRFRPLAIRAIISNVVAGAAAVVVALLGGGVWALVMQYVVLNIVQTLLLWVLASSCPGLTVTRRHFRDLFGFSRNSLGTQLLQFTNNRGDDFLIGAVLGPGPLGLYSVAYRLLTTLNDVINRSLLGVAFPVFSRLQDEPDRLRNAYCLVLKVGTALAFPGFLFFTVAAPEVVEVVFGHQWLLAAPVMAVLSIFGALQTALMITDSCLQAIGRPEVVFRIRMVNTGVQVAAFAVAAPFGIVWVAWSLVARAYLLAVLPVSALIRARVVDLRSWLRSFLTPVLATAVMLAAMVAVRVALLAHAGPGLRLMAMMAAAAVTYPAVLAVIDRAILRELVAVVVPGRRTRFDGRAGPRSPAPATALAVDRDG
ncbi:MAG: lipopolysaccharide biosynthesis protein [Pseudonocardia sp.]|nr:lipopolysaccharide biosynthesis protein [Pseudonocardia sp.]